MSLFHRHCWSDWKTVEAFHGQFVFGGGYARVEIQRRTCSKCQKTELNRQVA